MTVAELIQRLRALPQDLPVIAYDDGIFSPKTNVILMKLRDETVDGSKARPTVFIDGWGEGTMTCGQLISALEAFDPALPTFIKEDLVYRAPAPERVRAGGDYRGKRFKRDVVVI